MPKVIFDEKERKNLIAVICDSVLDGEREPSGEFVDALINSDRVMLGELVSWGASDTGVRENIMNAASKLLVNRHWPTYGDNVDEEAFHLSIFSAYDKWIKKNSQM